MSEAALHRVQFPEEEAVHVQKHLHCLKGAAPKSEIHTNAKLPNISHAENSFRQQLLQNLIILPQRFKRVSHCCCFPTLTSSLFYIALLSE